MKQVLHQRIAVIAAVVSLVALGIAVSADSNQQVHPGRPTIELPRLRSKDRILLHHDMKTGWGYAFGARSMSDEDATRVLGRTPALNVAWAALESGNRQWDGGHDETAIAQWHQVALKYRGSDAAQAALSNLGQVARYRGDISGAIKAYKSLLATRDPSRRTSMFPDFANYKHSACIELSDMGIESHDLRSALKYANLARHEHMLSDMCGTAIISTEWVLKDRIESLNQAIAERRSVRLK